MKILLAAPPLTHLNFWRILGLACVELYFLAVVLAVLCVTRRRWRLLAPALLLVVWTYFIGQLVQCIHHPYSSVFYHIITAIRRGPELWPALAVALTTLAELWLLWVLTQAREQITPSSVKETVDTLPAGICCAMANGRPVLVNRTMEDLCTAALDEPLRNANDFWQRLLSSDLCDGCTCFPAGESQVLLLPDGSARAFTRDELDFEGRTLTVLMAQDITDAYQKTLELERNKNQLVELNRRLASYNREIVDLTIQQEILNARIRLHDEMGASLLTIKKLIRTDCTDQELEEMRQQLRRNISFLKGGQRSAIRDEYELMLQTAEQLGVQILVAGALPQEEPDKHIVATGIHECFTNVLRHAHGDSLQVTIQNTDRSLIATFTGNGQAPAGPIRETGGLLSLRELTEQVGGTMQVIPQPEFTVVLTLPKEERHAI